MDKKPFYIFILIILFYFCLLYSESINIILEAEKPIIQQGSQGRDEKIAALNGEVLGCEFGSKSGHFAEYEFELEKAISPIFVSIRYARALNGSCWLDLLIDGKFAGKLEYSNTEGWGNKEQDYKLSSIKIPKLEKGKHIIRFTTQKSEMNISFPEILIPKSQILDLIGNRDDKNSVGHGKNIALYTGKPSKYFFATHKLGNIFDIVDGTTINWFTDHILVTPDINIGTSLNLNIDQIIISEIDDKLEHFEEKSIQKKIIEQRQVCVTENDVVVSKVHLFNPTNKKIYHTIKISGNCINSKDWRGETGGKKITEKSSDIILMTDMNVFPGIFPEGLSMAIGGNIQPDEMTTEPEGAYKLQYNVEILPKSTRILTFACAIDPDKQVAMKNLHNILEQDDPIALNREKWQNFYQYEVPHFSCSDNELEELYGFRWFLLKFSTAGGNLGFFKYPVVMEGRQAYQTYCCYSAPFMAFDLNWSKNDEIGFGHIANMLHSAYEDGRFPWYTSPRTNQVKLHHRSKTGLSLLPYSAWRHYLVHGNKEMLKQLYSGMKKNTEWWINDRDADENGLFIIDHQLETGMDDLSRWDNENHTLRYEAIDATSYAYVNILALANMARVLGKKDDEKYFTNYAMKINKAVNSLLWNDEDKSWRDRHPDTGKLSKTMCITTFYPFFAGIGNEQNLDIFYNHLLNPDQFWLFHPVPALPKNDQNFDPNAFWEGPSWPAATSHVIEALATSAKTYDRSLLKDAAELIKRSIKKHLQPRADFFERYNPITGKPLSHFRDYMHSWWIDIIIRHVVGFEPQENGFIKIDPLPMELDYFLLEEIKYNGRNITVSWQSPEKLKKYEKYPLGLCVIADGEIIYHNLKLEKWVEK